MCLYGVKQKGPANGSVADGGPARSEGAQGMVALRDVSVPVTAFPACGLAPSTVGAVVGILSALG